MHFASPAGRNAMPHAFCLRKAAKNPSKQPGKRVAARRIHTQRSKAVRVQSIWKRSRPDGSFARTGAGIHGHAGRVRSHWFDISLQLPASAALQKGDRVTLCGCYAGLYETLLCRRHNGGRRALLRRVVPKAPCTPTNRENPWRNLVLQACKKIIRPARKR